MEYYSNDEQQTRALAVRLAEQAQPGDILCLDGDLGAGKTVFAQSFCAALGVTVPVSSPTFTIVNEYDGEQVHICHFDLYRIADESELEEIGFHEYIESGAVCLIEWAENAPGLLPPKYTKIRIQRVQNAGETTRRITVTQTGEGAHCEHIGN